jgi:hypothetical protein
MCGCRSSETQRAKNLRVGRPGRMRPGLHKDIYRRYLALYPSPADPMESWGYDKYWNKLLALKILRAKYSFRRTYSNPEIGLSNTEFLDSTEALVASNARCASGDVMIGCWGCGTQGQMSHQAAVENCTANLSDQKIKPCRHSDTHPSQRARRVGHPPCGFGQQFISQAARFFADCRHAETSRRTCS